jgi:hypothetical protein
MGVRFNVAILACEIPESSWDQWLEMGYENPVDYLRKTYKAIEVPSRFMTQDSWREIRFRSRKAYTEFYLTWM